MPAGRPRVLTDEERKERMLESKRKWYKKQMESEEFRQRWCERSRIVYHQAKVATN